MKGLTFNVILVIILVSAIALVGAFLLTQVKAADIAHYLSSTFTGCGRGGMECCPNDWCEEGFVCEKNICTEKIEGEIYFDESFLIYNTEETYTRNQRENYFYSLTGLGEEECLNAINCENCTKLFNFTNAINCEYCDLCDPKTNTCENCLSCASAESNKYQELYECNYCSGCFGIDDNYMADTCSKCSYCGVASKTSYGNGFSCLNCVSCGHNIGDACESCYECGSEPYTVCDKCYRSASTTCEVLSEYKLCDKVKKCIAGYEGELCEIEEMLSLPWNTTYNLNYKISNILRACRIEDVFKSLPEGGWQKVCKYKNLNFNYKYFRGDSGTAPSDLFERLTSPSLTGENEGIFFTSCGFKTLPSEYNMPTIYYNKPTIFYSSTTPRTPEGDIPVNLKIVIPNISYNEQKDNECLYDIYLCAQEAIATSESDQILNFYEFFAYFKEWEHPFQRVEFDYFNPDFPILIKVVGIRFNESFTIDLRGREADVAHIAKAIIAGLRDHIIMNSVVDEAVEFFCLQGGMYSNPDDCHKFDVKFVIDDKIRWKLESFDSSIDTFSEIPNQYKYIYWNSKYPIYNSTFSKVNVTLTYFIYPHLIKDPILSFFKKDNILIISPVVTLNNEFTPPPSIQFCSDYVTEESCRGAGCKWCPSWGGIQNGCGDSKDSFLDWCVGTECWTPAKCVDPNTPPEDLPSCIWRDKWVGFCWICCEEDKVCRIPASECY